MPPMDVARNFKSVQVNRFRDVANKLLSSEASSEELQREVVVLNEQVKRFKSRTSQLRKRSEEHTSELQSLMRISYAVFCLKKKNKITRVDDQQLSKNNNDV